MHTRSRLLTVVLATVAALAAQPAAAQAPVTFGPQTDFATGLSQPYDVAQLADGRVLVAEYGTGGRRVSAYPAGGGARTDFATGLSGPVGVRQLADGRVLVTEYDNGRVSVYPAAGGARADFAAGLSNPFHITQLADGRILIADTGNGRISAYPAGGGARTDFATGLTRPTGITTLADGRVLVTEFTTGRISAYPSGGGARTDFATGLSQPAGMRQLADGRILVAEPSANRISVFPAAGGARANFATGLSEPFGVTQLADGRVLVTQIGDGRVLQFAPTGGAVAITELRSFNPSAAQGNGDGYRLLGAPVTGVTATTLAGLNLVQGIPAGTNPATHPAQYPSAPGPNLYTAYTGDGTYTRPDADDPLQPGRGFFWRLYDRTITPDPASFGGGTSTSRELTGFALTAFGPQAEADVDVAFADNTGAGTDDFQMLANPFARPLAVSGITVSGGTLQGTNVVQAYNPNGRTYVPRMGSDRLAVWQGVFAELVPTAAGGAVTVTYRFASTDASPAPVFYGRGELTTAAPTVRFTLSGTLADSTEVADEAAVVRFVGGADGGWDAFDVSKLTPPVAGYALLAPTVQHDGQPRHLAVDSRTLGAAATVPLAFSSTAAGTFTLTWTADLPEGWTATLADARTGETLDLATVTEVAFATGAAQDWAERFVLSVRPAGTTAGEGEAAAGVSLSGPVPNPTSGRAALHLALGAPQHVRASVVDALGREVLVVLDGMASGAVRLDVDTSSLAPGAYVVRVAGASFAEARRLTVVR